jgi:hypothetical protein
MGKSKSAMRRTNIFEKRPDTLPHGDADPHKILCAVGQALSSWEMVEVSYSYLFNTLARPQGASIAIRRAYGSIISARSRREMIEAAAETFFHFFPFRHYEDDLKDFMRIYGSASSRRNEFAHGVVYTSRSPRTGFYLEANDYNNKRGINRLSPYAYTSDQIMKIAKQFTAHRFDVEAFRSELARHFQESDPKARERY